MSRRRPPRRSAVPARGAATPAGAVGGRRSRLVGGPAAHPPEEGRQRERYEHREIDRQADVAAGVLGVDGQVKDVHGVGDRVGVRERLQPARQVLQGEEGAGEEQQGEERGGKKRARGGTGGGRRKAGWPPGGKGAGPTPSDTPVPRIASSIR